MFKIGKPIEKHVPKDAYKIHLTWMYGDADNYDEASDICDTLSSAEWSYKAYRELLGRRPDDVDMTDFLVSLINEYRDKEGSFIKDILCDYDSVEDYVDEFWEDAPYDSCCDCRCCLTDLEVTYYDKNGVEHEVAVKD